MPIVAPEHDPCLRARLESAGIDVMDEATAAAQEIRPARIGLLNLMPAEAMERTEIQWLRCIGNQALLQIDPVLIKFDDDRREDPGSGRAEILKRYKPFSEIAPAGLDGLIVTGDNLEIRRHTGFSSYTDRDFEVLPPDEIRYYKQLQEVMDWADDEVHSSWYSCLAGQLLLHHRYGLQREVGMKKIFGVYDHDVLDPDNPLVRGVNDRIRAPHSRWGNIPTEKVVGVTALRLVSANEKIGWLYAEAPNNSGGSDVLTQGHPEYGRRALHREYDRPESAELEMPLPVGYYKDDVADEANARLTWASDNSVIHANWIGIVYRGYSSGAA